MCDNTLYRHHQTIQYQWLVFIPAEVFYFELTEGTYDTGHVKLALITHHLLLMSYAHSSRIS